jgi:hypothetical protein
LCRAIGTARAPSSARRRIAAAELRLANLALERLADHRLPFFFLFAGEHAVRLFAGAGAQRGDFLGRFRPVAAALEHFAHFSLRALLDFAEALFLLRGQAQGLRHFGIRQRLTAALLERDLLEPLELVFFKHAGNRRVVGFGSLLPFLPPFFGTQVLQVAPNFALLGDVFGDLLDLLFRKFQFILHGLLR